MTVAQFRKYYYIWQISAITELHQIYDKYSDEKAEALDKIKSDKSNEEVRILKYNKHNYSVGCIDKRRGTFKVYTSHDMYEIPLSRMAQYR